MNEYNTTQFGKYRIESEIGRGGFGTVYRATDTILDRPVALKVMEPILMRDTVWVSRFRREARLMAKLDHPNIVPIHEIDEVEGQLFIAMKLIDGSSLADHIKKRGRFQWNRLLPIMEQVASALDYAYSLSVVHRDLKPSNVLLSGNNAFLTDFGFARLVGDNSQSITVSGSIVGTPAYIAPEVWEGNAAGSAADTYALGCILYEMVTGQVLFHGDSTPSIMLAHFRPPPLPEQLPGDVPAHVIRVIEKALAREPDERYATAIAMVQALEIKQKVDYVPDFALQLKERADSALERGDIDAAYSFITSLRELFPNDPDNALLLQRYQRAKEDKRKRPQPAQSNKTVSKPESKAHASQAVQKEAAIARNRKGSRPSWLLVIAVIIFACMFLSFCSVLLNW